MHANPFALDTATPAPSAATQPASRLPFAFAGAAALAGLFLLLFGIAVTARMLDEEQFASYLESLPVVLTYAIANLLLTGLAALLICRSYLERHNLAGFSQRNALLGLTLLLVTLFALVIGWGTSPLLGRLMQWSYDNLGSFDLGRLATEPLHWALFALGTLLPLWLSVHLLRRRGVPSAVPRHVAGWEPALAFGLCFAVVCMKLLMLLPSSLINPYGAPWLSLLLASGTLIYGGIAFIAALTGLPARLARHNPGRLVWAALLCLVMWLVACVLAAAAVLLAALGNSDLVQPPLFVVLSLGLLALIWPLTRLSLRWVYRAQPA